MLAEMAGVQSGRGRNQMSLQRGRGESVHVSTVPGQNSGKSTGLWDLGSTGDKPPVSGDLIQSEDRSHI